MNAAITLTASHCAKDLIKEANVILDQDQLQQAQPVFQELKYKNLALY